MVYVPGALQEKLEAMCMYAPTSVSAMVCEYTIHVGRFIIY